MEGKIIERNIYCCLCKLCQPLQVQYHDWIRLVEVITRYKTYIEVSHLRPVVPVSEDASSWWRYAARAELQQGQMW